MKILEKHNPHVAAIKPYQPGKPIEDVARELGLDPDTIIKLASNESGIGPSPKAIAALKESLNEMHRYPDGGAYILREAIAQKAGLMRDNIIVGNGSNEILELVGHCFLQPGRNTVFSHHAFVVYKLVSVLFGAEMREIPATPGLGHDLTAMAKAIDADTAVVFICSPNNPTGTILPPAEIKAFMKDVPESCLTVFDEAYGEIALGPMADTIAFVQEERPVLISRTFSKAYGLAGLRLGYGLGPAALINAMQQARQPFNCNLAAQVAGTAALEDDAFIEEGIALYREAKAYLENWCIEQGLEFIPSAANFMLIKVGDGAGITKTLEQEGVIVRPMGGYDLPAYIRVSYGTMAENQRFAATLARLLS